MTIYLVCDCGKKLKARCEYAGRRVMCTRCQRVWRLSGPEGETALEPEPLAPDDAEPDSLASEYADSRPRKHISTWLAIIVAVVAFLAIVLFLYHWYTNLGTEPRPGSAGLAPRSDSRPSSPDSPSATTPPTAPQPEPGGKSLPPLRERAPERSPQSPPIAGKPPEPLPERPEIERVEPAEPLAGSSVIISLRDKGPRGEPLQFEYRVSPKEPWQPVVGQRIKLTNVQPGKLPLEVRAVDPRGRETPVLQRPIVVKPAPAYISRLKQGDVLYQELVISRVSTYRLLGADVSQNTQYGFLSSLTVDQKYADGSMLVIQKVEVATLEKADPVLQALIGDGLEKTKGLTFRITLSPSQEVLRFEAPFQPPQVFGGNAILGQAFLVWSFVDQDAWKEIAQTCLFLPDRPLQKDEKWSRKLTHSWGALGMWSGDMAFHHVGQQNRVHRINYALNLHYQPPAQDGGRLPFKVSKSQFTPQAAGGTILFDAAKCRVTDAEERFHVRGQLDINLLGKDMPIEMDELQVFRVKLHDKRPRVP